MVDRPWIDEDSFPGTSAGYYWTSSSVAGRSSDAWHIPFLTGGLNSSAKTNTVHARCVRGDPVPRSRFLRTTLGGDPVVDDAVTGLMWQGCPDGMTGDAASCTGSVTYHSWQDALQACRTSTWGGFADWYLPDVKELQGISDGGFGSPAVDSAVFPETGTGGYWSSTSSATAASDGWFVEFERGNVALCGKANPSYVQCARLPSTM